MTKENNKVDINKHEIDIDTLKKQNVNDLLSIKELYKRIEELVEKTTQIKYIDNTLVKKIKKEYKNLKKIILDENIQVKLSNDIETINSQQVKSTNDIETINSQLDTIMKYKQVVNIKELGAKGDGLTDDSIIIQTAIDKYDNIYFPNGTYMCRSIKMNNKTNKTLLGDTNSTLKLVNGSATWTRIINMEDSSNITIKDLIFDGNKENVTGSPVSGCGTFECWRVDNLLIDNIFVRNNFYGVSSFQGCSNVRIQNSRWFDTDTCIMVNKEPVNNFTISNCVFEGGTSEGIAIYGMSGTSFNNPHKDIRIIDCVFKNKGSNGGNNIGISNVDGLTITNNVIESSVDYNTNGINLAMDDDKNEFPSKNIVIQNNTIKNMGNRILFVPESADNVVIKNNNIYSFLGSGTIAILGNCVMKNNLMRFEKYNSASQSFIKLSCGDITFSENKLFIKDILALENVILLNDNHLLPYVYNVKILDNTIEIFNSKITNTIRIDNVDKAVSLKILNTFGIENILNKQYQNNYNFIFSNNLLPISPPITVENQYFSVVHIGRPYYILNVTNERGSLDNIRNKASIGTIIYITVSGEYPLNLKSNSATYTPITARSVEVGTILKFMFVGDKWQEI